MKVVQARVATSYIAAAKCSLIQSNLQVRGNSELMYSKVLRSTAALALLVLICFGAQVLAQSVSPDLFNAMQWRLIGPFRGSRVVAVAGIPGDGATYFFGSVGGGVWKTPNAGVTWTPLFDGQPIASIGALAVARSNPEVIYVGTGESDIRSDLSSGDGVYKSSDGGKTWANVGLKD